MKLKKKKNKNKYNFKLAYGTNDFFKIKNIFSIFKRNSLKKALLWIYT